MKLSHRLIFLITLLFAFSISHAQNLSHQETLKILKSYEWKLVRIEKNGSSSKLSDDLVGMRMIFASKVAYMVEANQRKEIELNEYSIKDDILTLGENIEDPRFRIKVTKDAKYTLLLSDVDDFDAYTYVWDQGNPITGDGMPKSNYKLVLNRQLYSSTPPNAQPVINSINEQLKESIGNLRFGKGSSAKVTVMDASIYASEFGVKLMVSLKGSSSNPTIWTYDFMPEYIDEIEQLDLSSDSPIGQFKVTLREDIAYVTNYEKSGTSGEKYTDKVYFNFLKIDPKAADKLKKDIEKLRDIYSFQREERLQYLCNFMDVESKFWISASGASKTFELGDAFVSGGTIRLNYYLSNISTSGDSKEWYMTVIPLKEIEEITLDKSKSKPNTIILHAGKRGFATYKASSDDTYKPTTAITEIPIFIDVSKQQRLDRVLELLKTHVRELGGKKLSL